MTAEWSLGAVERQLIPTRQNKHASQRRLHLIPRYRRCFCLVRREASSLRISLSLSLLFLADVLLSNDAPNSFTAPFPGGPGFLCWCIRGWGASPPGTRHIAHTPGSLHHYYACYLHKLLHLCLNMECISQIWLETISVPPGEERRRERRFIPEWDCLFITSSS